MMCKMMPCGFAMTGWIFSVVFCGAPLAAQPDDAASAAQAAEVLDLRKLELIEPIGEPMNVSIAQLSYKSKGKITDVAKKIQAKMKSVGCEELAGATFTNDYGNASYRKSGFHWSLSLSPIAPGEVMIAMINHGNIDFSKISMPKELKLQAAFPAVTMFDSSLSAEETIERCRDHLGELGWKPFGETTVSCFLKKNAVVIQIFATANPALQGRTSVQLTSEMISADLPAPPYNGMLQWSESTRRMIFDSDLSQGELIRFFNESLEKSEWKPTTDEPVKIDFRNHLIYRNPKKEYLELTFQEVEQKTRCELFYQTAEEFIEGEARATAAMEKRKMQSRNAEERKGKQSVVAIAVPEKATIGTTSEKSIDFSIPSGRGKASLKLWLTAMEEKGWIVTASVDSAEIGEFELTKEDQKISVSLLDPGFIPGSITVRATDGTSISVAKE